MPELYLGVVVGVVTALFVKWLLDKLEEKS